VIAMLVLDNAKLNICDYNNVKLQDIYIVTKRNHIMYQFDKHIKEGNFKELNGKYGVIIRFKQVEDPSFYDYFILMGAESDEGRGLFVSNNVFYGRPTSKCYEQYRREIGDPVSITKEQLFLDSVQHIIQKALPGMNVERIINIDDTMRLKLSDYKVRKVYETYCGKIKNKPFLKPDMKAVEEKSGRLSFIEVERTKHRDADFLNKLMKIRMLGRRTYFLFNGEENQTHHLELIALFEREISEILGKRFKFTYIYYATVEHLEFFGKWEKYV
jgi:hypothetical protein